MAIISESQSLRRLNVSDRHREWLQRTLPHQVTPSGRFYDSDQVAALHEKIRLITGDPPPEEQRHNVPAVGFSGAVDSGVRPRTKRHAAPLENRLGPSLESR